MKRLKVFLAHVIGGVMLCIPFLAVTVFVYVQLGLLGVGLVWGGVAAFFGFVIGALALLDAE